MADLGNFALIFALALAVFATLAAALAALKANERLRLTAARCLTITGLLVALAVVVLGVLLQRDDFSNVYVYGHSNLALPTVFKVTAIWGGSAGSLLWWTMILCVYTWFFLFLTRKLPKLMTSWAMVFIGLTTTFFLIVNNIEANPFQFWGSEAATGALTPFQPRDGNGLNPQLQHWAMVIHPPLLYTGYIGFLYPFALTMGALITRLEGREWLPMIRRWTLVPWLILGVGIILGGAWAYMELGWGGYWAWDPVENASFMPWLLATAFIHSIMAQEKRGMFKLWNILLLFSTFIMCLFGTAITRSGLISSVHAFAESNIGIYFFTFIGVMILVCVAVLYACRKQLKDDNVYESLSSRETGLLFNNILFITICVTMLLATIYPMLTEWLGTKRELRHHFYNKVEIPIFLALMLMMAVGPILTWKRTSNRLIRERFIWPTVVMAVVAVVGLIFNQKSLTATISFAILSFLAVTIFQEFWEVVRRRMKRAAENPVAALVSVIRANRRRYGGYIAHFAVLVMGIGLTGAAFNHQGKEELGIGETMQVGGYNYQVAALEPGKTENYEFLRAQINLIEDGKVTKAFFPEVRHYFASKSQASEVAIHITPARDHYVVIAGYGEANTVEHPIGIFHIYVNPLVLFVWFGGFLMVIGTVICLLPERARAPFNETVPAGIQEAA